MSALAAHELPILVVDDRSENLRTLEAVLAPLGFPVVTARSGREALKLLLDREFALILLDVQMPGLDGLETARLIKGRERTQEIPIVFLTAARDEIDDIVRGYGVGAIDYVLKPFDTELLRSKVAVFAELERSRRALRRSELFLRGAFEAAPIGKTVLDAQRRIVRANPAFARLTGHAPEVLEGMDIAALCEPADRLALEGLLDRVAAREARGAVATLDPAVDLRLTRADMGEAWVTPSASVIDATSELGGPMLLIQWVEVSARRRAEEARAELLLEQAARANAEAQTERLERLRRLAEPVAGRTLDQVVGELAERLAEALDAVEVQIALDPGDAGEITGQAARTAGSPQPTAELEWEERTLFAEGSAIGTVRIAFAPGRGATEQRAMLMGDAIESVSLIIRRVELAQQEHRIAVELQRGLMPARLPELDGVELAAHYSAAGPGAEVGGDWYDAFVLSGERIGLVIGDVTGSGVRAASAMGQLRSVTRAFALGEAEPPAPSEVLERLHRYHETLEMEQLCTVLYLVLDRGRRTVTWANAGHPPPLLRSATGTVRVLHGAETMMGIAGVEYRDRSARLQDGDVLLLYTDGLVERRGEALDDGISRLAGALAAGPGDPTALCDQLVRSVIEAEAPDDDVTTVVLRLARSPSTGSDGEPETESPAVQMCLPADASAPAGARGLLERAFAGLIAPDELDRAKLAISELATNAVRHGRGNVTVRAHLTAERLRVEVADEGAGFEPARSRGTPGVNGGWGLGLVAAESTRWGVSAPARVWFEIERG